MTAALLVVQAAVGMLWAVLMFRTLFRLRARAVRDSGQMFPGPGATLRSFAAFLTDPAMAADRRQLGLATLAMFASIAGFTLTRP